MPLFRIALPILVLAGLIGLVNRAARPPRHPVTFTAAPIDASSVESTAAQLDLDLAASWHRRGLTPAQPAGALAVARRISLALHGTIPSLEEIARLRADRAPGLLDRWTQSRLADRRFEEYFAERLARAVVGTAGGQFLIFRRDRLVDWLAQQLKADLPWAVIVRHLVAQRGLWTGKPATNFITQAVNEDKLDRMKLAGRTVRAFLGQRIDCAQCHDHPFADWKQSQFEGLAAFYGGVHTSGIGVADGPEKLSVEDRKTLKTREVEPAAPYAPELLPAEGTSRERLAAWLTDPKNRRFPRALANRVWGFMFGKPLHAPVDDLPDPPAGTRDALDVLADDLIANRYSIRRLVRVIAASRTFRLASVHAETDPARLVKLETAFAMFPLVRLRPEQVIGGMLQANSIKTVDRNANLLQRAVRVLRESDFVKHYGDFGDTELDDRGGTIPQRLLMLNGKLLSELTEANPFSAVLRIAGMAADDAEALEFTFLACLTRLPEPGETVALRAALAGQQGDERYRVFEDLYWTLLNTTEFSWNH